MAEVNGVTIENPGISAESVSKSDCCRNELGTSVPEDMTAKDYYFDSYAHFGIHEVTCLIFIYFFLFLITWKLIYLKILHGSFVLLTLKLNTWLYLAK